MGWNAIPLIAGGDGVVSELLFFDDIPSLFECNLGNELAGLAVGF